MAKLLSDEVDSLKDDLVYKIMQELMDPDNEIFKAEADYLLSSIAYADESISIDDFNKAVKEYSSRVESYKKTIVEKFKHKIDLLYPNTMHGYIEGIYSAKDVLNIVTSYVKELNETF